MAHALGTPLLPWQQYVADVAGERREDGSYEYEVVVVSVPRQSGKTTLIRAVGCQRAAILGRDAYYTAQTGKDARERFIDLVKQLRVSLFQPPRTTIRRAAGSEAVVFPGGSQFRVFAPTAESLHGYTAPTVFLDEAFAHTEEQGDVLMGAIGPTQFTIIDKQIWIVSTAGTADSGFLRKWLDKAIAGEPRVACFIWAADEDLDPFAAETIASFHPAVGFELNGKTINPGDVLAEVDRNSRAEYERAFLNRWTLTQSHLIPREKWAPLEAAAPAPTDLSKAVLAYDVAYDQMSSSIVALWYHDSRPHAKVVLTGPGVTWLAGAVDELAEKWRCTVAADDNGPARDVTDQLLARGRHVVTTDSRGFSTATGRLLKLIQAQGITHDGNDVLANAIAGLATRVSNDGVAFSRRHSTGDVSAACALTVGLWFLDHQPPAAQQPLLHFGGAA